MKERSGSFETFPTLVDLVTLAREGKLDELLLGLAKRQDAAEKVAYGRAVAAYEHRTDNPKASWGECETAGVVGAGVLPSYEDSLVRRILVFCDEQRFIALLKSKKVEAIGGNN